MFCRENLRQRRIRAQAWGVLFFFGFLLIGESSLPSARAQSLPAGQAPLPVFRWDSIPENLGRVEDFYDAGPSAPVIFIVQDAHAVVEAQRRIRDLLLHLEANAGVRSVGVEGAEGALDPVLFKTFPDSFIRARVYEDYLQKGELSGAELAAFSPESRAHYFGIEDWDLYEDNHLSYLRAAGNRAAAEALAAQAQAALNSRVSAVPQPLRRFYELREKFYRGDTGLMELLTGLQDAAKASGEESLLRDRAPEAALLAEAAFQKEDPDLDIALERMAAELIRRAGDSWKREEKADFQQHLQLFKTGGLDSGTFLLKLTARGEKSGLRPALTPAMRQRILLTERVNAVRGTALFEQLESVMDAWEDSQASSPEIRGWLSDTRALRRLRHLARLEMTRAEFDLFQKEPERHLALLGAGRRHLESAADFYRLALRRDQVFLEKIERAVKRHGARRAAVVSGGFHSQGLKEKLRLAGYSYAVLTPAAFSLEGEALYEPLMKGQFSFRDFLETTYYDAFARHAGSELMREVPEPEFRLRLKLWREDIIRTLADQNRISEVGHYTRYTDRLFSLYQKRFGPQAPVLNPETALEAVREEAFRFEEETGLDWKRDFEEGLGRTLRPLLTLERAGQLNAENVTRIWERRGKSMDALSIPRASGGGRVLAMHFADSEGRPLPDMIDRSRIPLSPDRVLSDALAEVASYGASAGSRAVLRMSARESQRVLDETSQQAQALSLQGGDDLRVLDVNQAAESLRAAMRDLPGGPEAAARSILGQEEQLVTGTEGRMKAGGSGRSELRAEYAAVKADDFDARLNYHLQELQWIWYGAGENGQAHEDNLYRQIKEAQARFLPDLSDQFDPAAVEAYNSQIYRILDQSYNNPKARLVFEKIRALPGVDYRVFFFHGSIFDAFKVSMAGGRAVKNESLEYAEDMPADPGFYRFDTYDLRDFHQVFVELVQNNQRHMRPNNMIMAVKRESGENLELIYYYGNLNTDDAARIEESLYGGEYANDNGGDRSHAFFNVVAPAVFRLGGTIKVEFSGKAWEFYPKNWATWRWLRALPGLWLRAWYTLGTWFFRSGAGRRDLGPSTLTRGHGVKVTLSLPRSRVKKLQMHPGIPARVEYTSLALPGSLADVAIYSAYDEEDNRVRFNVTSEEMQGPDIAGFAVTFSLPGTVRTASQIHSSLMELIKNHPQDYRNEILKLDPAMKVTPGRRFNLSRVEMDTELIRHLLGQFIPAADPRLHEVVQTNGDFYVRAAPGTPDAAAALRQLSSHIRQTFTFYESAVAEEDGPAGGVRLGIFYNPVAVDDKGSLPRSELRAEEAKPETVFYYGGPREDLWAAIVGKYGLEKITTGGSTKVYSSSVYAANLLKKKEIPETEIFRIEAPWNTLEEYYAMSSELAGKGLAIEERRIVIQAPDGRTTPSNLSWQEKIQPAFRLWDRKPELRPALAKAAFGHLQKMWKQGYFDADFKMSNIGVRTLDGSHRIGLFDFDFVYPLPSANDEETVYRWLRDRSFKKNGRLHLSPGEHFLNGFFYYDDGTDDESAAQKNEFQRLGTIRSAIFPGTDAEAVRRSIDTAYGAARKAYRSLRASVSENELLSRENVQSVKSAMLKMLDEDPVIEKALRELAASIVKVRSGAEKADTAPDGQPRSELRSLQDAVLSVLGEEETGRLDKRISDLAAFYRTFEADELTRALFFYPGIFAVFLGAKPGFLSFDGKDPYPIELIEALRYRSDFPVPFMWQRDPGLIFETDALGRRLLEEGEFLFRHGLLEEDDRPLMRQLEREIRAGTTDAARQTIRKILRLLVLELIRQGDPLSGSDTNQDAMLGFLLGYPGPSVEGIMRWRRSLSDEENGTLPIASPETRYPEIGIATDYSEESASAALRYHQRLEAVLDYAYSRFAAEFPDFEKIEQLLELPSRSELRSEEIPEETPDPASAPEELGLPPQEWPKRMKQLSLFWQGEEASKFGEMKELIMRYRGVRGMRMMVTRLAGTYLKGSKSSFNEVAGELFIVDRLVRHLSPDYEVEVLGLGLNAGFREIDAFLKIIPRPGAESGGPGLAPGFYTLEAKEDSAVNFDSLISYTISSQVIHQIRNSVFFSDAGLPYRGAIVAAGGENSRVFPERGLKEEPLPEDSPVPVYSFVTEAFSIEKNPSSRAVPEPGDQDLNLWYHQALNIENVIYKVLLPAFGLPIAVEGEELRRREKAIKTLEQRERKQREIARHKIHREKVEKEMRVRELERRAREVEGWGDYFEGIEDADLTSNPLLLRDVLRWYFGRLQFPVDLLRFHLHQAAAVKGPAEAAADLLIREASGEGEIQGVYHLETSASKTDRQQAWQWLKAGYLKALEESPPPAAQPSAARPAAPKRPARTPDVRAASEAKGFTDVFAGHPDLAGQLTKDDAGYAENVLWVYFIGNIDRGIGVAESRRKIQEDIARIGRRNAWKEILKTAENHYGGPVDRPSPDRSELRLAEEHPDFFGVREKDLQLVRRWLRGFDAARVIEDIRRAGSVAGAEADVWGPEADSEIAGAAESLREAVKVEILEPLAALIRENGGSLSEEDLNRIFSNSRLSPLAGALGLYEFRDRLTLRLLQAPGAVLPEEPVSTFTPSEEQSETARFLLDPSRRGLLNRLLSKHFARDVQLPESSRLFMDLSFFEGTALEASRTFVEEKVRQGGLTLAYLRSTETRDNLAAVFRLPGVVRKPYTLEDPLKVKGDAGEGWMHILVRGTPVEADAGIREALGVLVSAQTYSSTRLAAPEFASLVELVLSVESLKRQLPDHPGVLFPDLPEKVIRAVFGLLDELMTLEEARRAFASAA